MHGNETADTLAMKMSTDCFNQPETFCGLRDYVYSEVLRNNDNKSVLKKKRTLCQNYPKLSNESPWKL